MTVHAAAPQAFVPQTPAGLPGADSLTVEAYLRWWLTHARGRVRATTYAGYEALLRCHAVPRLGTLLLIEVAPLNVQAVYAALLEEGKLSSGTILNLHLVLTQALGQAARWGLLPANPVAMAQPPRPRRAELAVVDAALAQRILERATGTSVEAPCAIAIATGMRRGEICGLRWSDLAPDWSVLHVRRTLEPTRQGPQFFEPKTRRSRRAVALPRFLHPFLDRQRDDQARRQHVLGSDWVGSGLVIDSGDGDPLHPCTLTSRWRLFLRREGLPPIRFHDLRHAHATLMLSQGVHPKVVSERLGHASVGITLDLYSSVLPSLQTEAAQAIDGLFTRD
jgi:integrase